MSTLDSNRVSVTYSPTFRDEFLAAFAMLRHAKMLSIIAGYFPIRALYLFLVPILKGEPPRIGQVLSLIENSSVPFLFVAAAVWVTRRFDKKTQATCTYSFDSEGVYTNNAHLNQSYKWAAILKVRQSNGFLFVFVSPTEAICLPLRELQAQGVAYEVRQLARQHTDFR